MNAFVAGNIEEVRMLATSLLKAVSVVSTEFDCSKTEIKYKDGEIIISYPMDKE